MITGGVRVLDSHLCDHLLKDSRDVFVWIIVLLVQRLTLVKSCTGRKKWLLKMD